MPAWKEILLEGHEVRALQGTCRQVVAVEPNSGVASACAAARNESALLDKVESVQPAVEARVRRLLHDSIIATPHVP